MNTGRAVINKACRSAAFPARVAGTPTRQRVAVLVLLGALATTNLLTAQTTQPGDDVPESVTLDTRQSVSRKLAAVDDYLEEREWGRAIETVEQVVRQHGNELMRVAPGRYVSVADYCHMQLARLPAAGLAAYREKVDPQARRWFEAARTERDEALMRRVVRQAFASSYGDEALLTLGDAAWEHGELDTARRYWRLLLPVGAAEEPLALLRYPDADELRPFVLARLVLATAIEGDSEQAQRELDFFRQAFPDVTGQLAGREGKLVDILQIEVENSRDWSRRGEDDGWSSFAGNAHRRQVVAKAIDVGTAVWEVPLSTYQSAAFDERPALDDAGLLSHHPAVLGDMVLLADAYRVWCYRLRTGQPFFEESEGLVYADLFDRFAPQPSRLLVGVPRFTVTVHEGKLYARTGSPVTARAEGELRPLTSSIICLDLAGRQGDLKWKVPASDLGDGWAFDGTPVASEGRVYVALRRNQPQTELNVACFDAETGRLRWNRRVCAAVPPVGAAHNFVSHQLLTLGEETLFLSTDLGAVAALDAADGTLRWVVTYESQKSESIAEFSSDMRHGLLPGLYDRGTLYVAPNDSGSVMAIDAGSGVVLWRRALPKERIRHLLGVAHGKLVVSGNSLWAIDARTGAVAWGAPELDPEFYGYGRGLLVEDTVWWPTRRQIVVVDQRTGRRTRAPIELRAKTTLRADGETGGNLLIAGGMLLIAQPDRLVALSEFSLPQPRPRDVALSE